MANPLPKAISTGTIGELLVQLRLLEYGIQAAPPIKDSGNDLIAIKNKAVKFIQVKTTLIGKQNKRKLPKIYDFIFSVDLKKSGNNILLDNSNILVIDNNGNKLGVLNSDLANNLWAERQRSSNF